MYDKRLEIRLRLIKKSAEMTKDLTPEEMITRGFNLISFARNAPKNLKILEET